MNFLAHLYLSESNTNIMIGNFIADHIKGNKFSHFHEDIQKGIYYIEKLTPIQMRTKLLEFLLTGNIGPCHYRKHKRLLNRPKLVIDTCSIDRKCSTS